MPYDIHVVRTADWLNASTQPITKDEVDHLIAKDTELSWSSSDYVDFREKSGKVARYFMICWKGEPCFYWLRCEIIASKLDQDQFAKLIEIAQKLKASVIGDEGEVYTLRQGFFGKKIVTTPP